MKHYPGCFPFNSKRNQVLLQFFDRIAVTYIIPEGNSVSLIREYEVHTYFLLCIFEACMLFPP